MKKFLYYVKRALKIFSQAEMRVLPGNVAFFFVLALIPIVTIVMIVASYFSISIETIINLVEIFVPGEAGNLIVEFISGKGFDTSIGAFNIVAFFVATNGTYAIISASNTLYQVNNTDTLKDRIKSILLLFILLLLIVFLLVVPLFGEKILSIFGTGKIVDNIIIIYQILRWPTTFFLIYVILKLIYTIAPSKMIPSSSTTYGAMFTTAIWTIATAVFSYYLKYFANYNVIYGNLSSIIILMMWLYIISYVFVMGIAINVTNLEEN